MQNWLRLTNGYTGPANGVMGVNSWRAVQTLAAHYGYTGPLNGVMGPNSWRGFARFINLDAWD
jgi:murein DD-endopeptidase